MLPTFIGEAVAILRECENPRGRLMRSLMSIIYDFDRINYELLIENILIKKRGQIVYRNYDQNYAEYRVTFSDVERHRAYLLFNTSDFEETIKIASEDPYVSHFFVYAQEGYHPNDKELKKLAVRGVNITYANVQTLAQEIIHYDLLNWVIAIAMKLPQKRDDIIKDCLYGHDAVPGLNDAIIYLIEQLNETDLAEVVYGLIIRQGCVVKREVLDNGCEFIGTDVEGYPIHFRTQINPTKNDFEKYYQIVLKKQKLTPNLRGYFCHLTNYDPDFCVSESERDPNSQFGEIESLGPRQLISFFNATSWLSRWLTQRYCRPKELT